MTIGIYVTSLTPQSAAQARFQRAVLAGLKELTHDKYNFLVFSPEVPPDLSQDGPLRFLRLDRDGGWRQVFLKRQVARILFIVNGAFGLGGGRIGLALARWMNPESRYHAQLRAHNIRMLWNLNQHELPTTLPFIRTIWDVNHRIHSMYPEYSYSRFGFEGLDSNMASSLARASYVIVGTEEGKRQVVRIFGTYEEKIRVIPFPTPDVRAPSGAGDEGTRLREGRPYIFYPARFWPHKNHVVILEALKILREKWNIELDCVFSGTDEGNLDYVMRFADRLGVRDRIEHVGLVSDERLGDIYRQAFALTYASAVGPDNLPPLEAMAVGCPVITADVPGVREQCGNAVLYFRPTNELELAERIRELYVTSGLRADLIDRGRARAASWTPENYARAVLDILDEFAATARAWERCDSVFT